MPFPSERPISGRRFGPKMTSRATSRMTSSVTPIPKGMRGLYHRLCEPNPGDAGDMKKPVAEQVIVISGASSGIGRATARAAGERGARVVVSARNAEALAHAVAEIEAVGGEGLAVPGEAASEADAAALCDRAVERFGRIDTFVASVMVTVYAEVDQLEEEELPVSWGAQKLLWGQKLSPRAGDLVLLRTGWTSQTTGEPKPVDAPDNLFEPLAGDPGAHGRFDDRARASSAWTAARLRLGKIGGIVALAAPAVALAIGYHGVTKRDW